MPGPPAEPARVTTHPGSSKEEIEGEPSWAAQHNHRIGYLNAHGRIAGLTHDGDHGLGEEQQRFVEQALAKRKELLDKSKQGHLVDFRDVMKAQTDFHERRPDVCPPGWRFVVRSSEDWVKKEQDWPANIKNREKEEKKNGEEQAETHESGKEQGDHDTHDAEHDWRRAEAQEANKHHGAYGRSNDQSKSSKDDETSTQKSEYERLREKYSPEEIALLQLLQQEKQLLLELTQNDGRRVSPVQAQCESTSIAIDVTDVMTPDNWIPRSSQLVRRTGQHPLNAEPRLQTLYAAGLITPNELHYVRNHGGVPRLYWETHILDVCDGKIQLSMDDLKDKFDWINIAVALACDGNRRGEMNMIRKTKGFDWGPGAISCAYWKGALLYQVLEAAGVDSEDWNGKRRWINFEGADEPSEGKYATSIPLEYALDPANDVILAYEMNNTMLPPDHGFPVRLMIPGYVGGRCVKWLARIWISDHENDSHYHIWDNRVLPSFISEKDGEFARTMFNHPSTACNEQNLNSIIVHPGQGEKIDIPTLLKQTTYRVEGYAYDGGGHEIQRVELSLDNGKTWLYCIREFPDAPIRNGNKFWTWLHWHIEIDTAHLVRATSLIVRCFNVFKNTQPENPVWNVMGMMNNAWYIVNFTISKDFKLVALHPFHQEDSDGWMKPSASNQIAAAKQSSDVPDKRFTRNEIEKHNSKGDCWLIINGCVYDVTSVISWHPGGSAALLANAGKLSNDVTTSFESIHDAFAHKKLQECVIGKVTDKAFQYMTEKAKAEAADAADSRSTNNVFLNSKKWVPVELTNKKQISSDTFVYTFKYQQGANQKRLGLGTCQHIQFGIHMLDKMLTRSYTPTRPIIESDEDGTFELTVKTYYPDENQPGGAFSNFLLELGVGEQVDVCGPTGEIVYLGQGRFNLEGQERQVKKISLVLGGSGITPGYALIERITRDTNDKTRIALIDANKTEDDILLRENLEKLVKKGKGKVQVTHILSHPKDKDVWEKSGGLCGHVNEEIIKSKLFEPAKDTIALLCGPPAMIQKAALPALTDWGYEEDKNCFGF